jgi:fucose permease
MSDSKSRYSLIIACVIFLFLGIVTAGLGPVLPELSSNTGASLTAVGAAITAMFLGALISQIVSGSLNDKFGQKPVLIVSMLLLAAGTVGFTLSRSLWLMLFVTFVAGLGHGSVDLSTNVLISRTFTHKNTSIMNLLHFFFGLGAFLGPAMISFTITRFAHGTYVLWLASAALLVLIFFVLGIQPKFAAEPEQQGGKPQGGIYASPILWLMGVIMLVYVGVENGLSGWITTYMNVTTSMAVEKAALVSSGFWGALMVGRLVTAVVGGKWNQKQILMATFGGGFVFGLLYSFSAGNMALSIVSIIMMGFFSGAVYPTMVSLLTTTFKQSPGQAASVGASMGSIGGMLIPLAQGYLLENVSPVSSAWFIAAGLLLMVILLWMVNRVDGKAAGVKLEELKPSQVEIGKE